MYKKLREHSTGLLILVMGFLAVTCMFGMEPQLSFSASLHTERFNYTFNQYMASSLRDSGTNLFNRVLTAVSYPGAKVGSWVHNATIAKE